MNNNDPEMPWEKHASMAITRALQNIEKDNVRGVMYLFHEPEHKWRRPHTEICDIESLSNELSQIGENEWLNYAPYEDGEPVFAPLIDRHVENAIEELDAESFFDAHRSPENAEEILSSKDILNPRQSLQFQIDITNINDEFIMYFSKHPEKLRTINPRKFEELVAELFKDMGYEVELTPISRDDGFDIRAVRKTDIGEGLVLIECKRYNLKNKVGVEIVRGLYGVVEEHKATQGVLVTTSYFTKPAIELRERNLKHRIALADNIKLRDMLSKYKKH